MLRCYETHCLCLSVELNIIMFASHWFYWSDPEVVVIAHIQHSLLTNGFERLWGRWDLGCFAGSDAFECCDMIVMESLFFLRLLKGRNGCGCFSVTNREENWPEFGLCQNDLIIC